MTGRAGVLTVAAWLAVVGVIAFVVTDTLPAGAATSPSCQAGPDTAQSQIGKRGSGGFFGTEQRFKSSGRFDVSDQKFDLVFDESRKPRADFVTVYAYDMTPQDLGAILQGSLSSNEHHSISEGKGLSVVATVLKRASDSEPATIRVCVKVRPHDIPDLRPGRFEGRIILSATGYRDASMPIVVTFRAPRNKAIVLAFVGVVIGLLAKMFAELGSGHNTGNPGPGHALRSYVSQWSFPLAILLGAVTGWLGFIEIYEANATWGVGGADSLRLFGTCFGFQMGSIGGADMAKRLVG